MPVTQISNIIVPQVFDPYVVERITATGAVFNSGLVRNIGGDTRIATQAGGNVLTVPYWAELDNSDDQLSDTANIVPRAYAAGEVIARPTSRVQAWSATDLSVTLSGSNPADALADFVAAAQTASIQRQVIAAIVGCVNSKLGDESVSPVILDVSTAVSVADQLADGHSLLDAQQLVGEAKSQLGGILVHSATETLLRKQDLIQTVVPSTGGGAITTYNGLPVIVSDDLPVTGGVYTTILYKVGTVGYADLVGPGFVPTETERSATVNGGTDTLIRRFRSLIAPAGYSFIGAPASPTGPTNAELSNAANWARRWQVKNTGLVALRHKVA